MYKVLLIDPAWKFKKYSDIDPGRSADRHYGCMSDEDTARLPIYDLLEPDAMCFMWTTRTHQEKAFQIAKAWGLSYSTIAFTWAKLNPSAMGRMVTMDDPSLWFMGLGYITRANCEQCLLFRKGKGLPRISKSVRELIVSPRRKHSQKPDRVYDDIEALYGSPDQTSYIEVFARNLRPGWTSVGNAIDGLDIFTSLGNLISKGA